MSQASSPRASRWAPLPDVDESLARVVGILVATGREHGHKAERIKADISSAFKRSLESGTDQAEAVEDEASQLDQGMPMGKILPATLFRIVFKRFGVETENWAEMLRLTQVVGVATNKALGTKRVKRRKGKR